ncbi:MAG: HAMP domain-containing histidine kinase [Clostridiales bacterium]|jgi:signal transduction histidine kinase|nr:HAMP domain-containing histidine kinase [Clostridiales bacterium]
MFCLVILSIAFLWYVQGQLFESNYITVALQNLDERLEEGLPNFNDSFRDSMSFISNFSNGKVFLVDSNGFVLLAYSEGVVDRPDVDQASTNILNSLYPEVVAGSRLTWVMKEQLIVAIGAPVKFLDNSAALIVFDTLAEMRAVQSMNRRQLLILSIGMTALASVLTFILSRYFTAPILKLKEAVDRISSGNFSPYPRMERLDELGELSRSVENLTFALQRVDVLRKEIIANVSHELRSPLSLIIGYGEMVKDITWKDEEKRNDNLGLIIREANRLSRMVDDIMDYSQLQAGYGKLNLSKCFLDKLVKEELDLENCIASAHGISIEFSTYQTGLPVEVDSLKISQALRNLLNNAINHTDDNMTALVSLTPDPGGTKVSVANPGNPIPLEERELIWERYRRVQHQGARREGTGIGLAIVKTILSAHSMTYGVDYEDGMNIFWFVVPAAKSKTEA